VAARCKELEVEKMRVTVRGNDVDQALRALRRKLDREGINRELRRHEFYAKPSDLRRQRDKEAIRRAVKRRKKNEERQGLMHEARSTKH
jgi:small subunit ribosomal protein S21